MIRQISILTSASLSWSDGIVSRVNLLSPIKLLVLAQSLNDLPHVNWLGFCLAVRRSNVRETVITAVSTRA